jgi:hypothetical protein
LLTEFFRRGKTVEMKTRKEMIAVMQAAEDGKEIETCVNGQCNWKVEHNPPAWNWCACDYRVKPVEPRRIWANIYPHCIEASESKARVDSYMLKNCIAQCEFIELTPLVRKALDL